MFSIKVIQNDGKEFPEELLYQAQYVEYRKGNSKDGTVGPGVRLLGVADGHMITFSGPDTTVFVMNEQGATVAKYAM